MIEPTVVMCPVCKVVAMPSGNKYCSLKCYNKDMETKKAKENEE